MNELCRLRPSASAGGRYSVDIRGQKALVNPRLFPRVSLRLSSGRQNGHLKAYRSLKQTPRRNPCQTNRKYYYLKLKKNYFDDDSIVLLKSMQGGVLCSNILLKPYLKSLKHGGRLQLDENIPYTEQMIATITRQQIGTVERALKQRLVEVLEAAPST